MRPHLFSAALASVMQERGINQVQLCQKTGIVVSRINGYLHAHYRTIKPAHVEAMVTALCGTSADKASLIQAYLFDLLPEDFRGMLDIRVPGSKDATRWKLPSKGLPKEFAEAYHGLYLLCASMPKVRKRTAEWIEIMRETKDVAGPAGKSMRETVR